MGFCELSNRVNDFNIIDAIDFISEISIEEYIYAMLLEEKLERVPVDLSKIMKSLGDETRLKILRCLYNEKNSTQEVALELAISEAAVSKHLKIMLESGLLRKERSGNYIHYILNKKILDSIPMNLYEYLAD